MYIKIRVSLKKNENVQKKNLKIIYLQLYEYWNFIIIILIIIFTSHTSIVERVCDRIGIVTKSRWKNWRNSVRGGYFQERDTLNAVLTGGEDERMDLRKDRDVWDVWDVCDQL